MPTDASQLAADQHAYAAVFLPSLGMPSSFRPTSSESRAHRMFPASSRFQPDNIEHFLPIRSAISRLCLVRKEDSSKAL